MEHEKSTEQIVRPGTPRSEDPARLNDLNPDSKSKEIAKDTEPKQTPQKKKQEQGKVRSSREGRDPGIKKRKQNRQDDQPTNPPHAANDGELWATTEQVEENNGNA